MEEHIVFNTQDVSENKIFGILSYIGILFIVPMIAAKESQYAKFHANQGIVLFITNLILQAVARALVIVLNLLSFGLLGNFSSYLLSGAVSIAVLALMIIGIMNACSGEPKTLPIIGGITLLR